MLDIWRTSCILVHILWRRLGKRKLYNFTDRRQLSPMIIKMNPHLYTPLAITTTNGQKMSPPIPNQRREVSSASRCPGLEEGLSPWFFENILKPGTTACASGAALAVSSPSGFFTFASTAGFGLDLSDSFFFSSPRFFRVALKFLINLPFVVHSGP